MVMGADRIARSRKCDRMRSSISQVCAAFWSSSEGMALSIPRRCAVSLATNSSKVKCLLRCMLVPPAGPIRPASGEPVRRLSRTPWSNWLPCALPPEHAPDRPVLTHRLYGPHREHLRPCFAAWPQRSLKTRRPWQLGWHSPRLTTLTTPLRRCRAKWERAQILLPLLRRQLRGEWRLISGRRVHRSSGPSCRTPKLSHTPSWHLSSRSCRRRGYRSARATRLPPAHKWRRNR